MNSIMKTAITILGVLLVICLAVLYSLSSQRKELLEELDGLRKNERKLRCRYPTQRMPL